jgi:hypothetical protein
VPGLCPRACRVRSLGCCHRRHGLSDSRPPNFIGMSARAPHSATGVLCDTRDEATFRAICPLCQNSKGPYRESERR